MRECFIWVRRAGFETRRELPSRVGPGALIIAKRNRSEEGTKSMG